MNKSEFETYITETYGVTADFPFMKYPDFAVFRHPDNRKWFAVTMTVPKSKLILSAKGSIDIVNIKCPSEILPSFLSERGIYPAYHMNKNHWLTLALDGSADDEKIRFLLDLSYALTAPKKRS